MDARSFQQHSVRVAEMTDALLAERAAAKASKDSSVGSPAKSQSASEFQSTQPTPDKPASSPDQTEQLRYPESAERASHDTSQSQQSHQQSQHSAQSRVTEDSEAAQPLGLGPSAEQSSEGTSQGARGLHFCSVCNVSTTSAVHLQTHYMGSKHQKRLAQAQHEAEDQHNPLHCSTCGITATSDVHFQLHLNGRAHQRKVRLASEDSQGDVVQPPSQAAAVATADEAVLATCEPSTAMGGTKLSPASSSQGSVAEASYGMPVDSGYGSASGSQQDVAERNNEQHGQFAGETGPSSRTDSGQGSQAGNASSYGQEVNTSAR